MYKHTLSIRLHSTIIIDKGYINIKLCVLANEKGPKGTWLDHDIPFEQLVIKTFEMDGPKVNQILF